MVSERFGDEVDRASGKAKEWAGRTTGNTGLQRRGRLQAGMAKTRIATRNTTKKLITAYQQWRRR